MTVGSGSPLTLFTATYDQSTCGNLQAAPGTLSLHDLAYGLNLTARGNPTQVTQLGSTTCTAYQISGIAYQMKDGNNNTMSITTSSSTAYSLPSVLTPNGNTSFNVNVGYSTFFAVTSVMGPNGASSGTNYDVYGRPNFSVTPDGATTYYCYTYSANASTQTAVISTNRTFVRKRSPASGNRPLSTVSGGPEGAHRPRWHHHGRNRHPVRRLRLLAAGQNGGAIAALRLRRFARLDHLHLRRFRPHCHDPSSPTAAPPPTRIPATAPPPPTRPASGKPSPATPSAT